MNSGAVLRDLRLNKNYRIIDIADELNVSPSYYGDIERGTRPQSRKVYFRWLRKIQALPKKPKPKRKDKFQLRAAQYNQNNPIENIEPEYFQALFLALQRPWLFSKRYKKGGIPNGL